MDLELVRPSSFYIEEVELGPRTIAYRPSLAIPRSKIPEIKTELRTLKKVKVLDDHIQFFNQGDAKNTAFNALQKNLNPDYCESTEELIKKINALNSTKDKVQELLNSVALPIMNRDGGSCKLVDVKDGIVLIELTGACGSCPSSTSTIKGLIERICREFIDGVKEVVQV